MSNANEKAFPEVTTAPACNSDRELYADTSSTGGLTKREYFAGLAMQAYVSSHEWREDMSPQKTAFAAVYMADALLEELEREK